MVDVDSKVKGALGITAGVVSYFYAPQVGPARIAIQGLGAVAFGYGIYQLLFSGEGLLAKQAAETKAALEHEAGILTSEAPGTTVLDDLMAIIGRATGNEPPPGIKAETDRVAEGGPYLGTPKNLLRVAGKIRDPMDGGSAKVPAFADTIRIDAAVENQAQEARAGILQARLMLEGVSEFVPIVVTAGRIELQPGEFKSVDIRIPYGKYTAFHKRTVALLFEGHRLDGVTFDIDRTFF